jgi:hypothetical protein
MLLRLVLVLELESGDLVLLCCLGKVLSVLLQLLCSLLVLLSRVSPVLWLG